MAKSKKRKKQKAGGSDQTSKSYKIEPERLKTDSSSLKDAPSGGERLPEGGEPRQTRSPLNLNPNYFLFFLLIVVLIGCYNIIKPYLHTIIIAAILAVSITPVHRRILKLFRGRENTAAFVTCTLITLIAIIPLMFVFLALIQQGFQSFTAIHQWIEAEKYLDIMNHPFVKTVFEKIKLVLPNVQKVFPDINLKDIKIDKIALQASASVGKILINQGGQVAGDITARFGKFFLFLFALFFFVRDEDKIVNGVLHLVPLSASQEDQILSKIKTVAKSSLLGTLVTALAQGFAGGIAFWVAGIPPLFWGMMMAFASLVPLFGTALIWIPASIYLIASGHLFMGIGMIAWCVIVVGSIDNFLRPLFMQGSADMSTLLIFFAIIGGINYFGLIGLLYGPLIFAVAMVLLYIYSIEFEQFLNNQDRR